ncbi:MAG TPA: hypothetical protein VM938_12835 [Acidimicrobiales bacterium]|nr:hypothetical protein [Acidimicrobiales bacterium]
MTVEIPASDIFDPGTAQPHLYLACKLTGLSAKRRQRLELECHVIQRAAVSAAVDDVPAWELVVYTPLMYTAPWRNEDQPIDIWRRNLHHVVRLADGLIVHGADGASFGVGNEGTLAYLRGIPLLYVHHIDEPVSRQTTGMSLDGLDMSIVPYSSDGELEAAVTEWVRTRRVALSIGPTMRASTAHLWAPLQRELAGAWREQFRAKSHAELAEVCFIAGMGSGEIEITVEYPLMLAALPAGKLVRLGAALGVQVAPFLASIRRLRELDPAEEVALRQWQERNRFGDELRNVVSVAARQMKSADAAKAARRHASGAPRRSDRYDLTTQEAWERLYRAWRDGKLG